MYPDLILVIHVLMIKITVINNFQNKSTINSFQQSTTRTNSNTVQYLMSNVLFSKEIQHGVSNRHTLTCLLSSRSKHVLFIRASKPLTTTFHVGYSDKIFKLGKKDIYKLEGCTPRN